MVPSRTVDVQDFITEHTDRKLSPLQIRTLALCFLIVAIDGFDTAAIGFIAPVLRAEWGVTAAQLAPLFGAGLFYILRLMSHAPHRDEPGVAETPIRTAGITPAPAIDPDRPIPTGEETDDEH